MGAYGVYIVMLVGCSLGVSVLALWLGRRLTSLQDRPLSVVVAGACRGPMRAEPCELAAMVRAELLGQHGLTPSAFGTAIGGGSPAARSGG